MIRIWSVLLVVMNCLFAQVAYAGVDEGVAKHLPWSGYWWPTEKGEILPSLQAYDALTGSQSYQWERTNRPPGPRSPKWEGYCHAWACAAILEKEPTAVGRALAADRSHF